jgi:hypothetical protein
MKSLLRFEAGGDFMKGETRCVADLFSKMRGKSHEKGMRTPAHTPNFGNASNVSHVA